MVFLCFSEGTLPSGSLITVKWNYKCLSFYYSDIAIGGDGMEKVGYRGKTK